MPIAYVAAEFTATVTFPNKKEFTYGEWTDKKLAASRKEYDRSNLGVSLIIDNPEDPVAPFFINVNEEDLYEGEFFFKQDGLKFDFTFKGKAKVTVHKLTKEKIDEGKQPRISEVLINGQGHNVDLSADIKVSAKKL